MSNLHDTDLVNQADSELFSFDPTDEGFCVDIVEAVASVAEEDARSFSPRLNDVIDPDGLVRCLRSGDENICISFSIGSYVVTATGAGNLSVSPSE